MTAERVCPVCGKRLAGRRNKRFCSNACKQSRYRERVFGEASIRESILADIRAEARRAVRRGEISPLDALDALAGLSAWPEAELIALKPKLDALKAKRRERKAVVA